VIQVVAFARDHGLRVAPQATAHGAAPLGALDNVLVSTSRMREVAIDAGQRRARIGEMLLRLTGSRR
jgi:FAD/FMN-containing dehydrogenase